MAELKDPGMEGEVPNNDGNPFSPENAPAVQLIVSMRIYDALMAILQSQDVESHDMLNEIHESGQLAWSYPWLGPSDAPTEPDDLEVSVPPTYDSHDADGAATHEAYDANRADWVAPDVDPSLPPTES